MRPLMLLLALLIPVGMSWNGQAAPVPSGVLDPSVSVRIVNPNREVIVTESEPGNAQFIGEVYVDKQPQVNLTVQLIGSCDMGWEFTCTPTSLVFNGMENNKGFMLDVVVPAGTSSASSGEFKVTGSTSGPGYDSTSSAIAVVTVRPYCGLRVETVDALKEVLPGDPAYFRVRLNNDGNAASSYSLVILNARGLEEEGWSVQLDENALVNVPEKGTMALTVTARPPRDWSWDVSVSRTTTVVLKIEAVGNEENGTVLSRTVPLYVYEKGYNMPMVGLIISLMVGAVVAAAAIAFMRRRRKRRMAREREASAKA